MSLFGSTYTCEYIFYEWILSKSKIRTQKTDTHLENSLRVVSSKIEPNLEKLVKEKHCQILKYPIKSTFKIYLNDFNFS